MSYRVYIRVVIRSFTLLTVYSGNWLEAEWQQNKGWNNKQNRLWQFWNRPSNQCATIPEISETSVGTPPTEQVTVLDKTWFTRFTLPSRDGILTQRQQNPVPAQMKNQVPKQVSFLLVPCPDWVTDHPVISLSNFPSQIGSSGSVFYFVSHFDK